MSARPPRLGDTIDDYCSRCRLLLNHAVVGMVGEEIRKVRCLTCHTEHSYRHGKSGKKKSDVSTLFDAVLRGMPRPSGGPGEPESRPAKKPPPDGEGASG